MTHKKSMFQTLSIAIVMAGCLSAPAQAAFFLEGLEPFSMRHCDDTRLPADVDTSISDPVVLSPAERAEAVDRALREFRPPCPEEVPHGAPGKLSTLPEK